jgi:hypothetical protein
MAEDQLLASPCGRRSAQTSAVIARYGISPGAPPSPLTLHRFVHGVNALITQGFHEKGFRAGKQSQAVKAGASKSIQIVSVSKSLIRPDGIRPEALFLVFTQFPSRQMNSFGSKLL